MSHLFKLVEEKHTFYSQFTYKLQVNVMTDSPFPESKDKEIETF